MEVVNWNKEAIIAAILFNIGKIAVILTLTYGSELFYPISTILIFFELLVCFYVFIYIRCFKIDTPIVQPKNINKTKLEASPKSI